MTEEQKEFVKSFFKLEEFATTNHEKEFVNIIREQEAEIEALRAKLKPVRKVYEQFKHLDKLLSDQEWLDKKDPLHRTLHD